MAIPVQTRLKVLAARERGESAESIARRLEIGVRTVYRLQARQRQNLPVEPKVPRRTRPFKLTAVDEKRLIDAVEERPGITAAEMIEKLSVPVVESTVCRAWRRLGLTRKKSP